MNSPLVVKYSATVTGLVMLCAALLGMFFAGQSHVLIEKTGQATETIVAETMTQAEINRGLGLAAAVQRIGAPYIEAGDTEGLLTQLNALSDRQDFESLRVWNAGDRSFLYQFGPTRPLSTQTREELFIGFEEARLVGSGPIWIDNRIQAYYDFTRPLFEMNEAVQSVSDALGTANSETSQSIVIAILIAVALAMTLGATIAIRIARRISQPIHELVDAVGVVARGDFDHELEVGRGDEIGDLLMAFNQMSRKLSEGQDVARKANEAEIARLEAEQASEAKTSFLANMSHEIRTPMNGVLGMAQLLEMGPLNPTQKQQVNVILRSGEALLTVINDILDISKLQAGQVTILSEPFSLRDTVEDVMALLGHTAREKGVELIGDMPIDVPSDLLGDRGRLRQVLINIVGNAIKFTRNGTVTVSVREVAPQGDLTSTRIAIDVIDTGVGIPAHKLDRIFNQFEQADNTTTREYGGTGLGLAIARQLSEAMGGGIEVASVPGEGSTFRIEIETARDPQAKPSAPADKLTTTLPVLLVDDDPVALKVATEKLQRFGAKPICARDADSAFAILTRAKTEFGFRFPLVVVDHAMAGRSGLDLVRQVRETAGIADTRFVAQCSLSAQTVQADYAALGVQAILEKPYPYEALTHTIRECLGLGAVAESARTADTNSVPEAA